VGKINGNIIGTVQVQTDTGKNAIGERVQTWKDAFSPVGWLGLQSGDSKFTHNAKLEESTHVFLCDFDADIYALTLLDEHGKTPLVRMVIKGIVYDVLLIDNPDEMDEQLEIYLRRVGAWNGSKI
jgi:hypothetical protein